MTLSLVRVDDRLVHGQVVVGWVQALGVKRIIVVDDDVSASAWQRELYALGAPPGLTLDFVTVAEAPPVIAESARAAERTIVLLGDVESAVRLCSVTPEIRQLNLGGLHDGAHRTKRLPYVYMTDAEVGELQSLSARGVVISARDVPTARAVPLRELL